jgi:hypothetical protein
LGATAPTITNESANDSSPAVSNTAGRKRQQSITGEIKKLFRQAVKAVTARSDPDERPETKRRKDETEGQFRQFARKLVKPFNVRAIFKRQASITQRDTMLHQALPLPPVYLSDTLDCMNPFCLPDFVGDDIDEHTSPQQDHHFPQL